MKNFSGIRCGLVAAFVALGVYVGCYAQPSLWKVDKAGSISVRDMGGTAWTAIPGSLKQIEQGRNGIVWGVNKNNDVYVRDGVTTTQPHGTQWTQIGGAALKQITIGCDGYVRGVSPTGEIYVREGVSPEEPNGTSWKKIDGAVEEIAVGGTVSARGITRFGRSLPVNSIVAIKCLQNDAYLTLNEDGDTSNIVARAENYMSRNSLFKVMRLAPGWVGFKNLGNSSSVQALVDSSKTVRAFGQKFSQADDVAEHFNLEDEMLLKCQSTGTYIGAIEEGALTSDASKENAAQFDFYIVVQPNQDIDVDDTDAVEARAQEIAAVPDNIVQQWIQGVARNVRKGALDKFKEEEAVD